MLAIIVGVMLGLWLGEVTFEPAFRFISNGAQYMVSDAGALTRKEVTFDTVIAVAGCLVVVSALATSRTGRWTTAVGWFIAFGVVFFFGAVAGLAVARGMARSAPRDVLGYRPLESAPILTAPLAGCAAVLLAWATLALRYGITIARSKPPD